MTVRRFLVAALSVVLVGLAAAPAAFAHANLEGTEPASGAVVKTQPPQLEFSFSEPVEGNFGAIRVYDRAGTEVQLGESFHPKDVTKELAIRLKPKLAKGTYTATFRIVSADGHPVSGGLVFSVGKASPPGQSVSDLLSQRGSTGPPTQIGFGIARAVQYGSIALAVGGMIFLFAVWLPSLAAVAGGGMGWARASEAFASRLRRVLLWTAAAGVVSGAVGIVFQGATAAGSSFWKALDPDVITQVLDTRFGTVWGLRVLVWLALAGALLATFASARRPVLRSASVGATGLALPAKAANRATIALLFLPLAFLAVSPALSGHASLTPPTAINIPANVVHVIAISTWIGGLVLLLLAVPAATRTLEPADRARLLSPTLARFSTLAGAAVVAIVVTGVVQAIIDVGSFGALLDTAFGRAVLIKSALLLGLLVPLGAYNRQRSVPRLKAIAQSGESPGLVGITLRRALRAEVAVVAVVLGVTAALVSYAPAVDVAAGGPASVTKSLGPADAQLTVDPARVGPNEMHVYLTDKSTGAPWDKTEEFTVRLTLPEKDLGPIKQSARKAGPGHYVMDGAVFGVAGEWKVQLTSRVSDFDEYVTTMDVKVG